MAHCLEDVLEMGLVIFTAIWSVGSYYLYKVAELTMMVMRPEDS